MKIYIAGPMTGKPNWNAEAFAEAEQWYSDQGHTVLNPASHTPRVNPESITHEQYMKIALAMVDAVDLVVFLDGWEHSKGAQMEYDHAIRTGKMVDYASDWSQEVSHDD